MAQVKSGLSFIRGSKYYIKADKDHFETWSRYPIPVVGIIHNPKAEDARWVNISEHLKKNPEQIVSGPYEIEAPENQPFTIDSFDNFKKKFQKKYLISDTVLIPPNLSIRSWKREDARPARALLTPIADDYPDFYDWLENQWNKDNVIKKVVDVEDTIAAYSMWTMKDNRNVKLQTFIVGSLFQGTAIGQHLLYHEIRCWSEEKDIDRVFVTISSSKVDLIKYFFQFGFRIEGVAANRYKRSANNAELVLSKHFVRMRIFNSEELKVLGSLISQNIWGIESGSSKPCRFGVEEEHLSLPLQIPDIIVNMNYTDQTTDDRITIRTVKDEVLRIYSDYTLMKEYYPLKLFLPSKYYVVVPIRPEYSRKLFAFEGDLSDPTPLKLRVDNVYYCTPRIKDLKRGDFVIFYETLSGNGVGRAFGIAVVKGSIIDTPERVWKEFQKRGIFKLSDIEKHTRDGKAMAIHFDLFEPFSSPIDLKGIRSILGRETTFQALASLSRDEFINIYNEGCKKND